jgi:hypothetical protein
MRQRINRSLIGGQQLITASSASGINTVVDAQLNSGASTWPQPVTTDPYFNYVPLLLNTNTTNAAQNNTFLDSSTNAFTITRNGTPTQGSLTPYQPSGYWSNYFGGNGNYLYTNTTPITSSSSTFTIEGWIYPTGSFNAAAIVIGDTQPTGGLNYLSFGPTSGSNTLMFYWYDGAVKQAVGNTVISLNTWTHIAVSVNANAISLYVNGVQQTITGTSTLTNRSGSNGYLTVAQYNSTYSFIGYISNLSVLVGTAKYSTGFTPSTTPLSTSTTNQTLLVCYSNQFIDSNTATTAKTITIGGTPSIQAFQPFLQPISYSPTAFGGSGYFNGSTDYLTVASNAVFTLGTNNHTIEFWIYQTTRSQYDTPWAYGGNGAFATNRYYLNFGTTVALLLGNGSGGWGVNIQPAAPTLNVWHHVAIVRNGNVFTLYIDGISVGTSTYSGSVSAQSIAMTIGSDFSGGGPIIGYMSNFRIVNGTAVYTSNFTPPTTPLTAISNTQLLTNFANAGIYDAAWQNNALTVGDAQVSTTQYKWGTTSMKFDGTGDYLSIYDPIYSLSVGSGNFTFECWLYVVSMPSAVTALYHLKNDSGLSTSVFVIELSPAGAIILSTGSAIIASGANSKITTGNWAHFAFVRTSGVFKTFINGVQDISVSNTTSYNGTYAQFAAWRFGGYDSSLNGYMQDVRITKGVARYTANFSVPTAAFPTYGTNILAVDYLVVAGGGGGGTYVGGGGGAGGYLNGTIYSLSTATTYTVTVGAGATAQTNTQTRGNSGSNSVFNSFTAIGGGGGGVGGGGLYGATTGGSGGGGASTTSFLTGAAGTSGQGYAGGNSPGSAGNYPSAGGGGASSVGASPATTSAAGGNGGSGAWSSLSGTSTAYAGGGGGAAIGTTGTGGTGGGGNAALYDVSANVTVVGTAGTANTGGGGGGGGVNASASGTSYGGGSGIVILRIPSRYTATFSVGLTTTSSTSITGYTIYNITNGTGTVTFNN